MSWYRIETLGHVENEDHALIDADPRAESGPVHVGPALFGRTAIARWPHDTTLTISPRYGRFLGDVIGTTTHLLVVSRRLWAIVDAGRRAGDVWEFLPVTVVDGRRRSLSTEHGVLNPLGLVDGLDLSASTVLRDPDDPEKILEVEVAVLARQQVDVQQTLFRLRYAPRMFVMAGELLDRCREAHVENLKVTPLETR